MKPLRMASCNVLLVVGILALVLGAGWPSEAGAGVIFSNANLPPESDPPDCGSLLSVYAGTGLFASYPGPVSMSDPHHKCFENVFRQAAGSDELETFDCIWDATMDFGSGPVRVSLTGPTTTRTYGRLLSTAGVFDAEITSMHLSGTSGEYNILLRESPTLVSPGRTDIMDVGGGLYDIDSFFDVYTELSLDGGENWRPQLNQAVRITLVPASTVSVRPTTWGAIKSLFK